MSKKIIEAQARAITDTDRKHFAKYEAMFESGAKERVVKGVDMTPIGESWQEVDRFDTNQIAGKTPNQLVAFFTELSAKHGDEVRITEQSYTTGGGMNRDGQYTGSTNIYFKVEKLGPEYSAEQRRIQLVERVNAWAATLTTPEYQAEQQKQLALAMKRIKKLAKDQGKK